MVSPLNTVPKRDSDERRVIMDLSYPKHCPEQSVNGVISREKHQMQGGDASHLNGSSSKTSPNPQALRSGGIPHQSVKAQRSHGFSGHHDRYKPNGPGGLSRQTARAFLAAAGLGGEGLPSPRSRHKAWWVF